MSSIAALSKWALYKDQVFRNFYGHRAFKFLDRLGQAHRSARVAIELNRSEISGWPLESNGQRFYSAPKNSCLKSCLRGLECAMRPACSIVSLDNTPYTTVPTPTPSVLFYLHGDVHNVCSEHAGDQQMVSGPAVCESSFDYQR